MLEESDFDTFASRSRELRDRTADVQLEIEACDRGRNEIIDIAVKAFELWQALRKKRLTAEYAAIRRILEILGLDWTLVDATLVPAMRKPFDMLAEGLLVLSSRGDRRWAFPHEAAGRALFHAAIAQSIALTEDAIRNA